jgi:hypothetical protein
LAQAWAAATGKDPGEFLSAIVTAFWLGTFEIGGTPETLAEDHIDWLDAAHGVPISRDAMWPLVRTAFEREGIERADVPRLSMADYKRMANHGHDALRPLSGLRLTAPSFRRWYRNAGFRVDEKPSIWPGEAEWAMPTQGDAAAPPKAEGDPAAYDHTAADRWSNLWQLVKVLAPKAHRIVSLGAGMDRESMADRLRAEAHLMTTDPRIVNAVEEIRAKVRPGEDADGPTGAVWTMHPEFLALLDQETARRVEARRSKAMHLTYVVIPDRLRSRLTRTDSKAPNGRFEVIARAADGREVTLSPRDLAGLQIRFDDSSLEGDGTTYTAVRVRRRPVELPAGAVTEPNQPHHTEKPKRVRQTNGRDFREKDGPLVGEMRAMIEAGTASSPENAALVVVGHAVGSGALASRVKRLALHYRQTYGAQS